MSCTTGINFARNIIATAIADLQRRGTQPAICEVIEKMLIVDKHDRIKVSNALEKFEAILKTHDRVKWDRFKSLLPDAPEDRGSSRHRPVSVLHTSTLVADNDVNALAKQLQRAFGPL